MECARANLSCLTLDSLHSYHRIVCCLQITHTNDKDWKTHVDFINSKFNLLFSVLMAISVGCILGVSNLMGLANPPFPVIGIPDPI